VLRIKRRKGEQLLIDGDMTVEILDVKGGQVTLGFAFDPRHTIYRMEKVRPSETKPGVTANSNTKPSSS
jgi:carbon storage regulator CsrA